MLCVYSHLIIFHELYGFGVSMENVALWLRVYSGFSIQCICMSKDNLNHPGIKVHLDHNIMEKKIWFSQNWQEFFFRDIFIFKKMDEITFFQFHLVKYNGVVLPNYFTQK